MNRESLQVVIVLGVASAIFFFQLGEAHLWDRDEPRNAGCALEMMQQSNWVVPIFNDELRFQKPVLLYWFVISAYQLFGVTEFAARFWSALLGVGTVGLTYLISRIMFNARVAFISGLALSSCLMFGVASRAVTPDSLLIFLTTAALTVYVATVVRHGSSTGVFRTMPESSLVCFLMYSILGLGVLAKGPVAFLLPTAIIGMYLLIFTLPASKASHENWQRIRHWVRPFHPIHFIKTCGRMKLHVAIAAIGVVAAPWYVICHLQTEGDFTRIFFLTENFGRATQTFENHGGGILYYPTAILAGFFPWSVFAVPVALSCYRKIKLHDAQAGSILFLICWIGVQVGLFSLAGTKLPSYVTPCYPALAILTAFAIDRWLSSDRIVAPIWYVVAFGCCIAAGIVLTVGLGYLQNSLFEPGVFLACIGAVPIAGGALAILAVRVSDRRMALASFAMASILFCFTFFGFGTSFVDKQRADLSLFQFTRSVDSEVASFGCLESSWVFYSRKRIHELALVSDKPADANSRQAKFWKPKPQIALKEFFTRFPDGVLVTTNERWPEVVEQLPGVEVFDSAPYFLKSDQELFLVKLKDHKKQASEKTLRRLR